MIISIHNNKCPATLPLFLITAASLFMPVLAQSAPVSIKYYHAYNWSSLPTAGLSSLVPYKTDSTTTINYPISSGEFATSGKSGYVAALFEGDLHIGPSIEKICVLSDDGSKLYLNGDLVVDNDGLHGSETKCGNVNEGQHYNFELEYFENGGEIELKLLWGTVEGELTVVPPEAFAPVDHTATPTAFPSEPPTAFPSDNPINTVLPNANTGGDPHFKTFNGKAFSYHGECDLVLMRSRAFDDGKGLSIHVRTTRMDNYRGAAYSLISAAAVQMGNTVLEVSTDDGGSLLIDGSRQEFANGDSMFFAAGYTLERSTKGKHGLITVFDLNLRNEKKISIRCNSKSMMLFVDVTGYFEDSEGLLGAPVGGSEGLGSRPNAAGHRFDMTGNWNSYGEEWQVLDTEPNLFQEKRFPQYPQGCVYESTAFKKDKRMLRRRLLLDSVDEAALEIDARKACAKSVGEEGTIMSQFCFNDVMATGDLELAEDPFYHTSSTGAAEQK